MIKMSGLKSFTKLSGMAPLEISEFVLLNKY